MAPDAFVVETHGLSKRFGDRLAVDSVDLRIRRGASLEQRFLEITSRLEHAA